MDNTTDNTEYAEHSDSMVLVQDISPDILKIINIDSLNLSEISFQSSTSLPKSDTKKNSKTCEFQVLAESSQMTIMQVYNTIAKYIFNNSKQKKLNNHITAFIVENLYPFSVLKSQAFKRIIEGLNTQANVLSNDCLKKILLNAGDNILQKIWKYAIDSLLAEANENSSLRTYKEKELSSDDWNKITELVKLLHFYEVVLKHLSNSKYPTLSQAWYAINFIKGKINNAIVYMKIFIKDEKQMTILEARMKYKEIGSNKLGNKSDTESQTDPTIFGDENSDKDIFSTVAMHFQEQLS
ncbi:22554_t:CDS:2 [Cetraspora pellucida]|uniref:22554_t:CDS:1 n=1 Tax=Cetraspora pellucida TaxID=1433469 RepID=A0A9N9NV83_9GLOM|nr:22554_t:CDS:2 [Cetraspora pellucida]